LAEATAQTSEAIRQENGQYLRELYPSLRTPSLRVQVVNAIVHLGGPENTDWLLEVASDSTEPLEVRRTALYATGVIGENEAAEGGPHVSRCGTTDPAEESPPVPIATLMKLYDTMGDRSIREQLLYAYSRRSESEPEAMDKLVDIAKHDPDAQLRQRAVFWLSQSKNPRAAEALSEIVVP
jgi:HEAT repeat protein